MSLVRALVASGLQGVLAGVVCDPDAAARAHAAGEGANVELSLGARAGTPGETPLEARFRVLALGDGRFTGTGPFYRGARFELGPMTLLELGGVHVAVASRKQQAADRAMFRHLRAEPADYAVLALKSSVHFRADFGPIASRVLVVEAPGPNVADPARLPFTKLRPGMRTSPRRV
jgi:microcystin degradation protein MlrC